MGSFPAGDEPNRCTAKSKQSGNRCTKPVVAGRSVCRYHGGLGGRPIVHGRYSKALGSLREAYEDSRNDPTLLELRDTLAVLDVIVQKAAARVGELDTPRFRSMAYELYQEAAGATDPTELRERLRNLGGLLRNGVKEDEALERLSDSVEKLARRQEKAWDLRLSAANAINARDMVALLGRFAEIVLDEANDETATRIIARIDGEIMGEGKTADRLAAGGDPLGSSLRELPQQPDGLHDRGPGMGAVEETE